MAFFGISQKIYPSFSENCDWEFFFHLDFLPEFKKS